MWKVDKGNVINARRDSWIPGLASGRISSNVSYESNNTVDRFFVGNGKWDSEALKANFLPFEVEAINRVPIKNPNSMDSRFWRWDKKGVYSVKSGYWQSFD